MFTRQHVVDLCNDLCPMALKPIQRAKGGLGNSNQCVYFDMEKTWPYVIHADPLYTFQSLPRAALATASIHVDFVGSWKERERRAVYDAFERLECTLRVERKGVEPWARQFINRCVLVGISPERAVPGAVLVQSIALDHGATSNNVVNWAVSILAFLIQVYAPHLPTPSSDILASLFGHDSATPIPFAHIQSEFGRLATHSDDLHHTVMVRDGHTLILTNPPESHQIVSGQLVCISPQLRLWAVS